MKPIISISFSMILMSIILLISRIMDIDNLAIIEYLQTIMIIASLCLTTGIGITYAIFYKKYNYFRKNPESAFTEDGKKINLDKSLVESKYVLLGFFMSGLSIIINFIL